MRRSSDTPISTATGPRIDATPVDASWHALPAPSRSAWEVDLALAKRCIAGEDAAQRELFARERRRAHATLYRILGTNTEMEDLLQDTFLEVFRSLHRFRGEALLSTWIDRIATRVAYTYLSRRRPASVHLELVPEVAARDASAEQRTVWREAARRLYAVLDRVEPRQRIAFTLHVIDGRPLRLVAETMKASLVATKTRVWRARREVERRARRDPVLSALLQGTLEPDDAAKEVKPC